MTERALQRRIQDFSITVATEDVAACDLCNGTRFAFERKSRDLVERLVAGEHRYVRCLDCRLCFLSPRPTAAEIGKVYPVDYEPHVDRPPKRVETWQILAGSKHARPSALGRLRVRIRQRKTFYPIPTWSGEGKILDVGCGSGTFLDTMKQLGWQTHGCDPSPEACAVAARKGHSVRQGGATELDYPPESFDVVYVNQVLEHTFSPRVTLRSVHEVLRPGGALVLAVPNYGSLQMRMLGRYSSALDPPRHLYQFERGTLQRYLDETGFHKIVMTTRTGAQSITKAMRLMVNDLFRTSYRREPEWLATPFEVLMVVLGFFNYFGAGRDLRVVALK